MTDALKSVVEEELQKAYERGVHDGIERVHAVNISEKCVQKTGKNVHEWVGLTAYEVQELHIKNPHFGNFACAIEAKLKEKNT